MSAGADAAPVLPVPAVMCFCTCLLGSAISLSYLNCKRFEIICFFLFIYSFLFVLIKWILILVETFKKITHGLTIN